MNQNIIFFSTFMMLGASWVNATEQGDRVSALKQQYISCLGSDYQRREAACRGIYEQLQRAQSETQQEQTIVFDKNQVQQAEAEARRQEQDARDRQKQLGQLQIENSTRNRSKAYSPTTVPTEPKNSVTDSVTDLLLYEIAQERRACERVQSSEVCLKIANERYQALQGQSTNSVASHSSSEFASESESSYRNSRSSSENSSTYRNSNTSPLPDKTTYEIEHSKLETPQRSGIREPQELRKAEGIREPQELRSPQSLGQREESSLGNTTYEIERSQLNHNR